MKIPKLDDGEIGFGTTKGLPVFASIPPQFKANGGTPWNKLVSTLFFRGAPGLTFEPHEGVDVNEAWKHCAALLRSWDPKHEHKEAGVAYLMSQYFKSAKWEGGEAS